MIQGNRKLASAWSLALMSALTSLTAFAADPVTIQLECDGYYPKCAEQKKELKDLFKAEMSDLANAAYQGEFRMNGKHDPVGVEHFYKGTVCPPAPVSLTACKDQFNTNKDGQSCGQPAKVAYGFPPEWPVHHSLHPKNGGLEASHIAGAMVLSIQQQYETVAKSIDQNALVVPKSSACREVALELQALISKHKKTANVKLMQGCDTKGLTECSSQKYFNAGVKAINASYLQIARCVASEQAAKEGNAFLASAFGEIKSKAIEVCRGSSQKDNQRLTTCYQKEYREYMEEQAKGRFPAAVQSCK